MATPPAKTVLRKDDFPSDGISSKDALERLLHPLNGALGDIQAALGSRLTFGENMNAELKQVTIKTPDTDWVTPALGAGWTNLGGIDETAAYRKDAGGVVSVRGLVVAAAVGSPFTLPVGYRPSATITLPTWVKTAGVEQAARLDIQASGILRIQVNAPSTWGSIRCRFECSDLSPGVLSCFPITVQTTVSQPKAVWLVGLTDQTKNNTVAAPAGLQWRNFSNGQLQITNLPGLTPSRTYIATILVVAG